MRKVFTSVLFVVFVILALAVPASAQAIRWGYTPQTPEGWYYLIRGDQVGMLTADNVGMVRRLTNQLPRSLGPDLRWGGNAYGIPIGGGLFYQMYDRQMRPMGRREATVTYGAIGAGIGYSISGNTRGTVIGATGGAIVGLLTHRGNGNNKNDKNVVVTPPSQGQGPISNSPTTGDWRVSNRTSKRAELWDGERFVARIEPWQSVQVDVPRSNGYKAVLLIPNRFGGLDQETAEIRSSNNFNGWDIVAPAVR